MNNFLSGLSDMVNKIFGSKVYSYGPGGDQTYGSGGIGQTLSDFIGKSGAPSGVTTPPPSPVPSPPENKPIALAPLQRNTPIFNPQTSTESAQPVVQQLVGQYVPKTPDVPTGWRSPINDYVGLLSSLTGQYGLDPRILPLLGIIETQLLRPGASGTPANNLFNTMEPGTQTPHQYPDIGEGLRQYVAGLAGPTTDPTGQGLERYKQFQGVGPNTTLEELISQYQNPVDDPSGEIDRIIELARQFGL